MNKITKRRTEITIETHEIKTIRITSLGDAAYCGACGKTAMSCSPEHIATMLQADLTDILRSIDGGRLHLTGTAEGVCVNSLENLIGEHGSSPEAVNKGLSYEPQGPV